MTYEKNFDNWHRLKVTIENHENRPTFAEQEIWWCSIGVNIGHEIDGKNTYFDRPVLILRKFNHNLFLGIPLSSKQKDTPYYHNFIFKEKKQAALLSHIRQYDSKRMTSKMGKLSDKIFSEIQESVSKLILRQ